MTVSGTTTADLDVEQLIDEAFERAGVPYRGGQDLRSGRRSLNLLLAEWGNRGLNMWTMEEGSFDLTAGTSTYEMPSDTVDILDLALRTNNDDASQQVDIGLQRISTGAYANIANKLTTGRPVSVLVERFRSTPILRFWPVPNDDQVYTFVYWRVRRLYDAGSYTNTLDAPWRFMPALASGLAYQIALKRAGDANRIMMLKTDYEEQFARAAEEDSGRTEIAIYPDFS